MLSPRIGLRQIFMVVTLFAFIACGGTTDPGEQDVNGKDDPGSHVDTGDDKGGDAERPDSILDDGAGDTEPEVTCVCNTDDECCDGCNALNESQACGPTGPCLVPGTCQTGVCVGGGPLVCDDNGACQQPGTCDPSSGGCVYEDLPNNSPCEAIEGLDGSGACLDGACFGFGRCDHRTYDQPTGYPCNYDSECEEGWCYVWDDSWTAFCSRRCGEGLPACPENMVCVSDRDQTGNRHCHLINRNKSLPGDASQPLYAVCNSNEDCEGGLCLAYGNKRFCTTNCEVDGRADKTICGTCGECLEDRREGSDEGRYIYTFYCVPEGSNEIGDPCGMSFDCSIPFCQGGRCSTQCVVFSDGFDTCPEGMVCSQGVLRNPEVSVCVVADLAHRKLGESCDGNWACDEGECLEYRGQQVCMLKCSEEEPCPDTSECLVVNYQELCIPKDELGTVPLGESCMFSFDCASGLGCYRGVCLAGCDTDEDCESGTCFLDGTFRAIYCAPDCTVDNDCPSRMTCIDGSCLGSFNGGSYLFGNCRVDKDCETGICVRGQCTETCFDEAPCEGSIIPEWEETNLCKPCNPWYFGSDCGIFNHCVQTGEDTGFCAPQCGLYDYDICPPGTRCYTIDGYTQACVPITGACEITSVCGSNGLCIRPVGDSMPCSTDIECVGGSCVDGKCLGGQCTVDDDCGCEMLVCSGGSCVVSNEYVLEVEPNDDLSTAQVIAGPRTRVAASLLMTGEAYDIDLFKIHLNAGQVFDVMTEPFCDQRADTYLRLVTGDGVPIEGWENDDIAQNWFFSWLNGFVAETAMDIYIEVGQSPYYSGAARFNYLLAVHIFDLAGNNTCEGAIFLEEGTDTFDISVAVDSFSISSCTGYGFPGKDLAFKLEVPAKRGMKVIIDAPFDSQLSLVSDCENANETCMTGADDTWDPGIESFVWANTEDEPANLFLIVDSYYTGGDPNFDLGVNYFYFEDPSNDLIEGAIDLTSGEKVMVTTFGAKADYDAVDFGCAVATPGPDVVYRVQFAPGDYGVFSTSELSGISPIISLVLPAEEGIEAQCLAQGQGGVAWQNDDEGVVTAYLIVDQARAHTYSDFDLLPVLGPLGEYHGPCDPNTYQKVCSTEEAVVLAYCNEVTKSVIKHDCNAACVKGGALSGVCHTFTTPPHEGDKCKCEYDCSLPNDHCDRLLYTNCTCSAADPCNWKEDGGCDELCEIEYPDDFFDDSVDCAPQG